MAGSDRRFLVHSQENFSATSDENVFRGRNHAVRANKPSSRLGKQPDPKQGCSSAHRGEGIDHASAVRPANQSLLNTKKAAAKNSRPSALLRAKGATGSNMNKRSQGLAGGLSSTSTGDKDRKAEQKVKTPSTVDVREPSNCSNPDAPSSRKILQPLHSPGSSLWSSKSNMSKVSQRPEFPCVPPDCFTIDAAESTASKEAHPRQVKASLECEGSLKDTSLVNSHGGQAGQGGSLAPSQSALSHSSPLLRASTQELLGSQSHKEGGHQGSSSGTARDSDSRQQPGVPKSSNVPHADAKHSSSPSMNKERPAAGPITMTLDLTSLRLALEDWDEDYGEELMSAALKSLVMESQVIRDFFGHDGYKRQRIVAKQCLNNAASWKTSVKAGKKLKAALSRILELSAEKASNEILGGVALLSYSEDEEEETDAEEESHGQEAVKVKKENKVNGEKEGIADQQEREGWEVKRELLPFFAVPEVEERDGGKGKEKEDGDVEVGQKEVKKEKEAVADDYEREEKAEREPALALILQGILANSRIYGHGGKDRAEEEMGNPGLEKEESTERVDERIEQGEHEEEEEDMAPIPTRKVGMTNAEYEEMMFNYALKLSADQYARENEWMGLLDQEPEAHAAGSGTTEEEYEDEKLCVVCLEEDRAVQFKPCGHTVCCVVCADKLKAKAGDSLECPMCRTPCESTVAVAG